MQLYATNLMQVLLYVCMMEKSSSQSITQD